MRGLIAMLCLFHIAFAIACECPEECCTQQGQTYHLFSSTVGILGVRDEWTRDHTVCVVIQDTVKEGLFSFFVTSEPRTWLTRSSCSLTHHRFSHCIGFMHSSIHARWFTISSKKRRGCVTIPHISDARRCLCHVNVCHWHSNGCASYIPR